MLTSQTVKINIVNILLLEKALTKGAFSSKHMGFHTTVITIRTVSGALSVHMYIPLCHVTRMQRFELLWGSPGGVIKEVCLMCGTERDNRANGTEGIMRALSERMSKNMLGQSKNLHGDAASLAHTLNIHTPWYGQHCRANMSSVILTKKKRCAHM